MIELRDVSVTFNPGTASSRLALDRLTLGVTPGQFVSVIGSNGAGKSTLLNLLSGEIRPDHGYILIDGEDITRMPVHARCSMVARVFQDPLAGTCENLTVEENLALAWSRGQRRTLGFALNSAVRRLCRDRLAQANLGLEDRMADRMGLLSGGQRQVVSLVMATLVPMKILLLDEHTAALDPLTADTVMALSDRFIGEARLTTLMVTHSMRQAIQFGQRTVMLHEGKIALDIEGPERAGMTVPQLLDRFASVRDRTAMDEDALLLD